MSFKSIINNHPHNLPKSIQALGNYSYKKFFSDLIAGVTVGLVALPLAMAFAISSGMQPQAGIYCAIVAGFLISALGGSMTQIGGPTGAFVVVVAGVIEQHGIDGLFICTLISGLLLMIMGLTGLGSTVKFIPRPVVIGFTNGIAVLIASTQIKDFFGLQIQKVPSEFLERIKVIFENFNSYSATATIVSFTALLLMLLMRKFTPKIPGSIVALLLGTICAWIFNLNIETIASRFGGIPSGLPQIVIPTFHSNLVLPLLAPIMTITMLGAIESLLSAVVADRMSKDKHNPNVELFAQGVANVFSPLVGGLPATGAIARTATNIRSGAKTPVAGMMHAITLLIILLVAAPLAEDIPLPILASILMVVAYNMGEWAEIPEILRLSWADISVWLITFLLTVFADLTVAVKAGMILAALLYIRKVTANTVVMEINNEIIDLDIPHSYHTNPLPENVSAFSIQGPFLFGASDKLLIIENKITTLNKVVIIRLRDMNAIDGTGLNALEVLADKLQETGRTLILCSPQKQPAKLMNKSEFHRHIGQGNIVPSLTEGIIRAKQILNS